MGRISNRSLALLALGVLAWVPAGASAGPLFGHAADPGPYYSPWHYRTPILYRLCEEHYYGLGPCSYRPDRYPVGAINPNAKPAAPGEQSGGENPAPAAGSAEASGPQAGP